MTEVGCHGSLPPMSAAKAEKFEMSLKKLEDIVHKLEEGDLSLEDSIKSFEEGMKLVKTCETRLNEVQKKIEILIKDKDGSRVEKEWEPE